MALSDPTCRLAAWRRPERERLGREPLARAVDRVGVSQWILGGDSEQDQALRPGGRSRTLPESLRRRITATSGVATPTSGTPGPQTIHRVDEGRRQTRQQVIERLARGARATYRPPRAIGALDVDVTEHRLPPPVQISVCIRPEEHRAVRSVPPQVKRANTRVWSSTGRRPAAIDLVAMVFIASRGSGSQRNYRR